MSKGKYKSGKSIGTRPIGAVFTPNKEPQKLVSGKKEGGDEDIEKQINDMFSQASFRCSENYIKAYKKYLTGAALAASASDNTQGLEDIAQRAAMKGKTNVPNHVAVFSNLCPGDFNPAAKIFNSVLDILQKQGKARMVSSIQIESKSEPKKQTSGKPAGQPETADGKVGPDTDIREGLSRGNLYRRRYWGRY